MSTDSRILIIDDDANLRKTLSAILKAKGYEAIAAATGQEALDTLIAQSPSVALIDLRMQGMTGLQVLREIKQRSPATECIVVTGYASQASAIEAVNLGAYSYVQKPYDVEQLLLTIRNAVGKRAAEVALRESESRFRDVLHNSRDIAYKLNVRTGSYEYVSPSVQQLYGFTPEETVAMGFAGVCARLHLEDRERLQAELDSLSRLRSDPGSTSEDSGGTPELSIDPTIEYRWQCKDGEYRWFSDNRTLVVDGDGRGVAIVGSIRDITERKRIEQERRELEEKLERARRMESLGVLAGGVAHDLNNLLGPLVAYPELILMELPEDSSFHQDIVRIKESAEKTAAVVQDLLALARRGMYHMAPLSLNTVVQQYLRSPSLSELQARSQVYLEISLCPELLYIQGSAPHLTKVLMNLVTNAFEAMPYGGKLTISTACETLDRPLAGYEYIEAGDYVVLRVADTGVGIEAKDLGRIFEPFYTSKKMGRSGSGLGLAVVYGVVQDHHGKLDVHTEVGKGTEFILRFPVVREPIVEVDEERKSYGGTESILVVDDREEQRVLSCELLSKLGYTVEAVVSGSEAIEHLAHQSVDLLVLDMILEDKLDGLDTYREVVKLRPGQRAIVASGFSETERVKEAQRLGAGQFVKKPYTLDSIGRAVRHELDRASALPQNG